MTSVPPTHLAKFNIVPVDKFIPEEKIYRRCNKNNSGHAYAAHLFLEIRWDDLEAGLSVNRSSVSNKEDVLWAAQETIVDGKPECNYTFKEGVIFESYCNLFPTMEDPNSKVSFALKSTPTNCNISHCDIFGCNMPESPTRPIKRDIKTFLSTFFQ